MAKASAQHELVGVIIDRFPEVIYGIAEVLQTVLPEHDQVVSGPNSHPVRKQGTIHTDSTIRLVKDGKPVYFAQVEMQNEYKFGKLTTLQAYHGSGVRNYRCGGRMIMLSPNPATTRSYRENDALYREQLAYQVAFGSGTDLAPLGGTERTFPERMVAAALTDFEDSIPARAVRMISEAHDRDEPLMANMLLDAMMEECADPVKVEEALASELAMQRLEALPSVQKIMEKVRTRAEKAEAEAARAEADAARAEADAAHARAEALSSKLETGRTNLLEYFAARGEILTPTALTAISACMDPAVLHNWLLRAYRGETAAQIFPEPKR